MNRPHDIMVTDVTIQEDEPRGALELKAKRAEAKLLATLEKVDRRRHRVEHEIERIPHQLLIGTIVVGGAVLGLIATSLIARRRPTISRMPFAARVEALERAWTHPDRVAPALPQAPGLARRLGATLLTTAASLLFSYLGKKAEAALIAADHED